MIIKWRSSFVEGNPLSLSLENFIVTGRRTIDTHGKTIVRTVFMSKSQLRTLTHNDGCCCMRLYRRECTHIIILLSHNIEELSQRKREKIFERARRSTVSLERETEALCGIYVILRRGAAVGKSSFPRPSQRGSAIPQSMQI